MPFVKIVIGLALLLVLVVGGYFAFTKLNSQKLHSQNYNGTPISKESTASPANLISPASGTTNLQKCDQATANSAQNCYWGSDEFSSPTYKKQK